MKIRYGFVSNSSTSSYLIFTDEIINEENLLKKININEDDFLYDPIKEEVFPEMFENLRMVKKINDDTQSLDETKELQDLKDSHKYIYEFEIENHGIVFSKEVIMDMLKLLNNTYIKYVEY